MSTVDLVISLVGGYFWKGCEETRASLGGLLMTHVMFSGY